MFPKGGGESLTNLENNTEGENSSLDAPDEVQKDNTQEGDIQEDIEKTVEEDSTDEKAKTDGNNTVLDHFFHSEEGDNLTPSSPFQGDGKENLEQTAKEGESSSVVSDNDGDDTDEEEGDEDEDPLPEDERKKELEKARETLEGPITESETFDELGMVVKVKALSGTFPKGTYPEITLIQGTEKENVEQQIIDDPDTDVSADAEMITFDIKFIYTLSNGSGVEVQPKDNTVQVTFEYKENEELQQAEDDIQIIHINDKDEDGKKVAEGTEKVETIDINEQKSAKVENGLVIDAESFSYYTIVVQRREEAPESDPTQTWQYGEDYFTINIARPSGFSSTDYPIEGFTIMDRNLGASISGTTCNTTNATGACGYLYQWGNNYGFPISANASSILTGVGLTWDDSYNNNGYVSKKFVNGNSFNYDVWSDSTHHDGIWGGANDVNFSSSKNTVNKLYWDDGGDRNLRQGPCPEGWHVPSAGEWSMLLDYWYYTNYSSHPSVSSNLYYFSDSTKRQAFMDYFYIPFAGYRDRSSASLSDQGSDGSYWSSSPRSVGSNYARRLYLNSSSVNADSNGYRAYGLSVRCFKDSYVASPDTSNLTDTQAWVEGKDFETITISNPDNINEGFTIMDRNLGAENAVVSTTASNVANTGSYGFHYQWGNNYGFEQGCWTDGCSDSNTSSVITTLATWNENGIYNNHGYFGNKFIKGSSDYWQSSLHYDNLRGGAGDVNFASSPNSVNGLYWDDGGDRSLRQGPCPVGYHVPSAGEWSMLVYYWYKKNYNATPSISNSLYYFSNTTRREAFMTFFKLPFAGRRNNSDAALRTQGSYGYYWSSSPYGSGYPSNARNLYLDSSNVAANDGDYRARGRSVRCFKDSYVAPPQPVEITYDPNGGAFSGMAENQTTLVTYTPGDTYTPDINIQNPNKAGKTCEENGQMKKCMFDGWYTTGVLVNQTSATEWTGYVDDSTQSQKVYAKWLPFEDLDLDFGNTTYTIMDRNLGAEDVAQGLHKDDNGNNPENLSKIGKYYQWGNNYGFDNSTTTWPYTDTNLVVNTTSNQWGPGNYYSSATFIKRGSSPQRWDGPSDTDNGANLWGGTSSTVSDKQGPCPVGYHIPSNNEWQNIYNAFTTWKSTTEGTAFCNSLPTNNVSRCFAAKLKLPFAGNRSYSNSNVYNQGDIGNYWSSTRINENSAYNLNFDSYGVFPQRDNNRALGFSVRCLKDSPNPKTFDVTFEPENGSGATVVQVASGSTITALDPEPTRDGYTFSGWYLTGAESAFDFTGTAITGDITLYAQWDSLCEDGEEYVESENKCYPSWAIIRDSVTNEIIQINDQERDDLELYFLQSDGTTVKHFTIMDRNLGATEVYNQQFVQDATKINTNSFGYHYQRGNNYGFEPCINNPLTNNSCTDFTNNNGFVTTIAQNIWSAYMPSKYARNTWSTSSNWMASSSTSDNIWGGGGDTTSGNADGTLIGNNNNWSDLSGRQGPCPENYYIPSVYDWTTLKTQWGYSVSNSNNGTQFASDLLLPPAGYRSPSKAVNLQGNVGDYWSSSPNSSDSKYAQYLYFGWSDIGPQRSSRSFGSSVRCAKSSPTTSTFTLHANGGSKAVIAFTGTVGSGKFTALGTPTRSNSTFSGWYTASEGGDKLGVGSGVVSDIYARWSCSNGYVDNGTTCVAGVTVTLNATTNGGTITPTSVTVANGSQFPLENYIASKDGYTFEGWAETSGTTGVLTSNPTITANKTLYAVFSKTLTGTFNKDDSTVSSISDTTATCTLRNTASNCILTAPTITCEAGYNGVWSPSSMTISANTTFTASCSDAEKPVCSITTQPTRTSMSLKEGYNQGTVTFTCTDNVGVSTSNLSASNINYDSNVVTLSNFTAGGESTSKTFTFTYTANAQGFTTFALKAGAVSDAAGNSNVVTDASNTVIVDTTAPTITITEPNAGTWTQSKSVTASASDGTLTMKESTSPTCNSSVQDFVTYADKNYISESDNGKYICYKVVDSVGNEAYESSAKVEKIDRTAPVLSGQTTFLSTWYTTPQTSTFTYSDTGAGINEGYNTAECTISNEGTASTCQINPNICDKVGNCNTTTQTSNSIKLDKTAPVFTGKTQFTTDWYNTDQTSMFTYEDTVSGINGDSTTSCVINEEGTTATCTVENTNICNNAGLCNTINQTSNSIKLDKTNPTCSITGNPTSPTNQNVELTLNYLVEANQISDGYSWDGESYSTTQKLTVSENGTYTGYVKDAAGNTGSCNVEVTMIDKVLPDITINNPDTTPAQSKTITATTDKGTLYMAITGVNVCDDSLDFVTYDEITFSSENDNGKYVCYKAEDTAGNITYGISNPISGIKEPSKGSNYSGGGRRNSKTATVDTHGSAEIVDKDDDVVDVDTGENKSDEKERQDKNGSQTTFTQEQIDAYTWAKQIGITTKPTIESTKLNTDITREQLAKMMVVFMSKVLGKQPVIDKTAKYRDVSVKKRGQEMYDYIQLAYQYQIMGIDYKGNPIRYFNPEGKVTRAEFATVLSRVLYGSKYNQSGKKYYEKHIKALEDAEILTNTNSKLVEKRGYVMTMLMRSAK